MSCRCAVPAGAPLDTHAADCPDKRRKTILDTLDDLVGAFLYYDRKEDEGLPRGAIDDAVRAGEITVDEMIAKFAECLRAGVRS